MAKGTKILGFGDYDYDMNFRELLEKGEKILSMAGITDAKNDAWLLLSMACHINHTDYYTRMNEEVDEEQVREFEALLKKRAERIPLQYITGEQDFMGYTFKVNSNVLIPRQDTETLVEEAMKRAKSGMHLLDLCTGSGCILISLMKKIPGMVGMGSDISKQALAVAKENARLNEVEVVFEWSNLFENIEESFDMIVSNPPYIPSAVIPTLMPEVAQFEPIGALDGTEDGLFFYRKIVCDAKEHLNANGWLLFEIGFDQGEDVSGMMNAAGYKEVSVIKDLAGNDRVVCGHL